MTRTKIDIPGSLPFSCSIPIRISDINYGGHLGNDAVLSIVHEARIQFLKSIGYSELNIAGFPIMMIDAVIVYTSEGFYGDTLIVDVGVNDLQETNCNVVFRLTNQESRKELARAKTGIVFINPNTRRPTRIPEEFRKRVANLS